MPHRATEVDFDARMEKTTFVFRLFFAVSPYNHHVDAKGTTVIAKVKRGDYSLLDRIEQTHWNIATYYFTFGGFRCKDISFVSTIDSVE